MLENVKPGDLITADFVNGLINMVNELEHRVETLESSTDDIQSVRITGFDPPEGQNLGQILRVLGENFAWPSRDNTVTIQNFTVTSGGVATVREFRPGSSPQMLEFQVPDTIAGIREGGTEVTITVETGEGSAQRNYRMLPALPTTGDPPTNVQIRHSSGDEILMVNEEAVITGENFSPGEIEITFEATGEDGSVTSYPVTDFTLNLGNETNPRDEIRLTVPDMEEAVGNPRPFSILLQVGNFAPVEITARIRR